MNSPQRQQGQPSLALRPTMHSFLIFAVQLPKNPLENPRLSPPESPTAVAAQETQVTAVLGDVHLQVRAMRQIFERLHDNEGIVAGSNYQNGR